MNNNNIKLQKLLTKNLDIVYLTNIHLPKINLVSEAGELSIRLSLTVLNNHVVLYAY